MTIDTTITNTESRTVPTGDRSLPMPSVAYDPGSDILTFDGFRFSGELMRHMTVTPCGTMFRIIERKDGTMTVCMEFHPLAALASDMLKALQGIPAIAKEIHARWDADMRSGKLLIALMDPKLKYRADVTAIHDAIAKATSGLSDHQSAASEQKPDMVES